MKTPGFVFMALHVDFDAEKLCRVEVWRPEIWCCKVDENAERVFIGEQTFDVAIPAGFDPTALQVAALQKNQADALQLYQRTVAEINERLQKLLALPNEVKA